MPPDENTSSTLNIDSDTAVGSRDAGNKYRSSVCGDAVQILSSGSLPGAWNDAHPSDTINSDPKNYALGAAHPRSNSIALMSEVDSGQPSLHRAPTPTPAPDKHSGLPSGSRMPSPQWQNEMFSAAPLGPLKPSSQLYRQNKKQELRVRFAPYSKGTTFKLCSSEHLTALERPADTSLLAYQQIEQDVIIYHHRQALDFARAVYSSTAVEERYLDKRVREEELHLQMLKDARDEASGKVRDANGQLGSVQEELYEDGILPHLPARPASDLAEDDDYALAGSECAVSRSPSPNPTPKT